MQKYNSQKKFKDGLSIHCHHDVLVEYCYDYDERVKYIKSDKPENEQEIRLRLFKILPKRALKDFPKELLEAYTKWQEEDVKRQEANAKWQEVNAKWQEAYAKWQEAYAKWSPESKDAFHKKWCGCIYWKNGKFNFEKSECK